MFLKRIISPPKCVVQCDREPVCEMQILGFEHSCIVIVRHMIACLSHHDANTQQYFDAYKAEGRNINRPQGMSSSEPRAHSRMAVHTLILARLVYVPVIQDDQVSARLNRGPRQSTSKSAKIRLSDRSTSFFTLLHPNDL